MKSNNPIYAKMFKALSVKTTEQIIDAIAVFRSIGINKLSNEALLSYDCSFEELENRVGDKIDEIIENIDASISA
jgi:hypothetical protein